MIADPPATHRIAKSNTAVAAASADTMAEYTNVQPGVPTDTTDIMSTPPTKSSAATSTIDLLEDGAAPTPTTEALVGPETLGEKPWPRLHLLGLPRELRDQIYTYAVVSDEPVFIGPTNKRFENIPPITRASQQLRQETHCMFLEQNTLEIDEYALMTIRSSKAFNALKALCAGSELQSIFMDSGKWVGPHKEVEIMADLVVVKTSDGLKVSLPVLFTDEDGYEVCDCRVQRLANEHSGQEGAIVRFLEALRKDWTDHCQTEYNKSWCGSNCDEHHYCTFVHKFEFCDIHDNSLLY